MASNIKKGTLYSVSSLKTHAFDVICIGSGWAARPITSRVVSAGFTALIIENELVGGDCPFWACVPSKALLRPSEALEAANSVGGARERISQKTVDPVAVFERRTMITRDWDDLKLLVPLVLETGTDILRGLGKLVGEKQVKVTSSDGQTIDLTARHAVAVCTGSVPTIPEISGLREAKPWTPREATSASRVPQQLIILGTGAVGCEMATAYASFGSAVTLISSSAEILSKVDPSAGKLVRVALEARGVRVLLQTTLAQVNRDEAGKITTTTSTGESLVASEILVAAGRKPQTDNCGLETFGLPINGTAIGVDESLRVKGISGRWLYAVGDINGLAPLTHMCKYQGRIAASAILESIRKGSQSPGTEWSSSPIRADYFAIPQVVFTQPAVAAVGLTRQEAEKLGISVRSIETPAITVGALLHGDNFGEGWAQWIVDADSNKLRGMTVVGQDATELIHAATVAIVGGLRLDQLAHAVPCFPTMSEVYLNLQEAAGL